MNSLISKCSKTFVFIISFFLLSACQNETIIEGININKNTYMLNDLSFDKSFSLSFWIKPDTNYFYSPLVTISNTEEELILYNETYDEDFNLTGVLLSHPNGSIYNQQSPYLETYNYTHFAIVHYENTFFLYMDGKLLGSKSFVEGFLKNPISISFGSDDTKASYIEIIISDEIFVEEVVKEHFENNINLKLENIYLKDNVISKKDEKITINNYGTDLIVEYDDELLKLKDGLLISKEITFNEDLETKVIFKKEIDGVLTEKEEIITILGDNPNRSIYNCKERLNRLFSTVISESDQFINSSDDCEIEYEVISGSAYYDDVSKRFIKDEMAAEQEKINIMATIKNENIEEHVQFETVLLDEYHAYVLATFEGHDGWPTNETGEESIYLYLSEDLSNWTKLNHTKIIQSEVGSNRFRDPFVTRDKTGNFLIIATEGYRNPGIYLIDSSDLIHFDVSNIQINTNDRTVGTKGQKSWAPEINYNAINDEYIIHFSEPNEENTSIYAVTTKDFKEYSYPYRLFDAGYNIIDSNITCLEEGCIFLYKDERETEKYIYYAKSESIDSSNWIKYDDFTLSDIEKNSEGPFLLKTIEGDYILYSDNYKYKTININPLYFTENDEIEYGQFNKDLNKIIRHFSIIKITEKEYNRLLEHYKE